MIFHNKTEWNWLRDVEDPKFMGNIRNTNPFGFRYDDLGPISDLNLSAALPRSHKSNSLLGRQNIAFRVLDDLGKAALNPIAY